MREPTQESLPFITSEVEVSEKPSQVEDRHSEEDVSYESPKTQQRRWRWRKHICSLISSFLVGILTATIIIVGINDLLALKPNKPQNRNFPEQREGADSETGLPLGWYNGDCGSTPEEAIALDCRYSIVLHSWLPHDCLTDQDREDESLMHEGRDWPYELDNGTSMSMEQLRTGQFHHFTTTFDWHVTHCMYVWKRMHRAMLDAERKLDSYVANFHHTAHCVKMIGGQPEGMKDSGTKIFVKYPKCA